MKPQSLKIQGDVGKADSLHVPWLLLSAFLSCTVILMLPSLAFAAYNDTVLGNPVCHAAGWMTGNLGKGLATIGVGIIAIKAMQGTITFGATALAGAGVAIIFGAAPIVHAIQPRADMTYCNANYTLTYLRLPSRVTPLYNPATGTYTMRRTPGRIIPYFRREL